ncbi:MAG: TonB-dependent receptor [Caulobacterales bacterium]
MSFKFRSALLSSAFGLVLAPQAAFAQSAASLFAKPVDTVIVTATRNPDDPPIVSEARERLSRTPGAVAVIANETYEDRTAQGLSDVLRDVPGVLAEKRYGEESRLSIRGSGIGQSYHQRGVMFAQDGVPFADADGFSDFQKIDPLGARYVEVYKGGNALRFGGAQLGGAINLITPTGRTAESDNMARLEGGSFGTARAAAQVARTSGDWDVFASASGLTSDGYRQQSEQKQARGSINLGYSFGEDREVRLIAYGADINQDVPGALTLSQALSNPKQGGANVVANDWARDQQIGRVSLQTRWRFQDGLVFEGGVYATKTDLHHPISIVIDQQSDNQGAFGRFDWSGEIGGHAADLYWGASYRQGAVDQQLYSNAGGANGFQFGDARQKASGLDVFAEGRYFVLPHLALVAGGSYGRATRDYTNYLNAANNASRDYDWFAPRFGALWQFDSRAQLYANVTRSVEPPHYGALVQSPAPGFVPVDAQKAWTGEVGARGRSGAFIWDVTLYRAHIRNELLTFNNVYGLPSAFANADKTIHQGIEAALDWRITEDGFLGGGLSLKQSYTYSDFKFDGDAAYGDNRLPVAPEHQYQAALRYDHPAGVFIAPSVEWRPKSVYVDYANTQKAPDFALLSLNAGWTVTQSATLFLDARNLTDKKYVAEFGAVTNASSPGVNNAVFYPGEGRAIFGGVSLRF